MRSILWPLMLLATLLTGCAGQPTNTTASYSVSGVDLDSFEGFSKALEQTMVANDTSLFLGRLDSHQFARRSLGSMNLLAVKDSSINNYARTLDKLLQSRFKNAFSAIESAHFVRLLTKDDSQPNEAVALMRIEPKGGGISYWEVYLRRTKGSITVIDWLNYSLGDLASHSIGDFSLQLGTAARNPELAASKTIQAYLAAAKSRDPQKILAAYKQLPTRFKNSTLIAYSQLQTASKVSTEAYLAALSEFESQHKKDDSYALMLVDYYLMTKDYEKAQQALKTMAKLIGEDAGLDSLHAGIAVKTGEYKRAIAHASDGISREPSYENNYWVLLDALVYSKNYADAVLVLNILEEGFSYQFNTHKMATLEGYEAFLQSAPYKGWYAALAQ